MNQRLYQAYSEKLPLAKLHPPHKLYAASLLPIQQLFAVFITMAIGKGLVNLVTFPSVF